MSHESPAASRALTAVVLGVPLSIAFEAYGTLTAMPRAAKDLGHLDLYAWAFTAFALASVLAIVIAGRITDRIGPAIPFAAGYAIFTSGLTLAGLAPTMVVLLLGRFIQGFGAGSLSLALMVLIAQAYSPATRARMMTAFSVCWTLPSFIGPPLSAWVTETFSWHWVFLGIVPFLLILAVVGFKPIMSVSTMPHEPDLSSRPIPIWAAIVGAGASAAIQAGGQGANGHAFTPMTLTIGAAGLIALMIALPFLMPPGFLRCAPGLGAIMWTRSLAAGSFFAAETFIPLALVDIYDFTLGQAGVVLASGASGWMIGSIIQSSPRVKLRRDSIIVLGGVVAIIAELTMAVTFGLALPWWLIVVGFSTSGAAMGLVFPSGSLAVMQISPPQFIGRNTSSLQVAEGLGTSVITGISGAIFAALHLTSSPAVTYVPIYLVAAGCATLLVLTGLRIGPVRNESSGVG